MKVPGISEDPERGARIRLAREQSGLTQSQLGDAIGVAARTISSWEHGAVLNHPNLKLAADELRTTARYLLTGEDGAGPPLTLEDHDQRMNTYHAALIDRVDLLVKQVAQIETDLAALVDAVDHLLLREALPAPPAAQAAGQRRQAGG